MRVIIAGIVLCSGLPLQAQETAQEHLLTEVRGVNMASPPDEIKCFQERKGKQTHICITESQWLRQHENDAAQK